MSYTNLLYHHRLSPTPWLHIFTTVHGAVQLLPGHFEDAMIHEVLLPIMRRALHSQASNIVKLFELLHEWTPHVIEKGQGASVRQRAC